MILDTNTFHGTGVVLEGKPTLSECAEQVKNAIKQRKDPLQTIDLVFPSDVVAQWFKAHWLKSEDGVLMNVRFLALEDFFQQAVGQDYVSARRSEIRALILKWLSSADPATLEKKVSDYLYDGETLSGVRLYDLADALSKLFAGYETDATVLSGWQKELYGSVMAELEGKSLSTFAHVYRKGAGFAAKNQTFHFFGFHAIDPLYVEAIKELSKDNAIIFYRATGEGRTVSLQRVNAPSKIREVEALHGKICSILQSNPKAHLNDFLVLCPDVSAYEREISRVFNQDGVSFPKVPYCLNAVAKRDGDVTEALKLLFSIALNRSFTRLDFAGIINNKAIQGSRAIVPEDVDAWQRAILRMNVYRNGKKDDDWEYAKRRLVLAKAVNAQDPEHDVVSLQSGLAIPYADIGFDDSSIVRFIAVVDGLHRWIDSFADNRGMTVADLDTLEKELRFWFSNEGVDGKEGNAVLGKLVSEVRFWKTFGLGECEIPLHTLFYSLFDLSQETISTSGALFTEGVSFVDFDPSYVLDAEYVFFLGAGSNVFPTVESHSEIDLRPESNSRQEEEYRAFKAQAAQGGCFSVSYVNRDLKGDVEFFPSPFLVDLAKDIEDTQEERGVPLDETRPWSELFTKKEYKDKDYYVGLFHSGGNSEEGVALKGSEPIRRVTLSQMRHFLEEGLQYQFERACGKPDDVAERLEDQYEPMDPDALTSSMLVRHALAHMMEHPEEPLVDSVGAIDVSKGREIFQRFLLERTIPHTDEQTENGHIVAAIRLAQQALCQITELTGGNREVKTLADYVFFLGETEVTVVHNGVICLSVDGDRRRYFELASPRSGYDAPKLLPAYVAALLDIANLESDDEVTVEIYRGQKCSKTFPLCKADARSIIERIVAEMNAVGTAIYLPIGWLDDKKIASFEGLVKDSRDGNNGSWHYFPDRMMFLPTRDLGYTEESFEEVFGERAMLWRDLVRYLAAPQKEEEGK